MYKRVKKATKEPTSGNLQKCIEINFCYTPIISRQENMCYQCFNNKMKIYRKEIYLYNLKYKGAKTFGLFALPVAVR